ncbi:MAG: cation:proton antiporter [Nanoarchaeales archaeon]|nr:cation:proton antiporter [Nanoarchaeales archaeon]
MDILSYLALIAGIIFIGFLSEIIFKKFSFPDVLLLSFVGIGLGTFLTNTDPKSFGSGAEIFSTFALIFILFQGASNINFKTLVKNLPSTLKLTVLSFVFTVITITGISYYFLGDVLLSLLIGMILSGTSSAVVIPLISNVEIKNKYGLVLTLESAISDVLCILGTLTVLEIMQTGTAVASSIFQSILSSFAMALLVGAVFGVGWILLFRKYDYLNNFYMLTIAFLLGVYVFVEGPFISASGPIAVLAFGLVLGNSKSIFAIIDGKSDDDSKVKKSKPKVSNKKVEHTTEEHILKNALTSDARNFYYEVSFFVKTFFFVYLGMLINLSDIRSFKFGLILAVGAFLIRPVVVWLSFRHKEIDVRERAFLEVLIPKGLAAAILSGVVVQAGILTINSSEFINIILSAVLISIVFSSIFVFLIEKNKFMGVYRIFNRNK